MLKRLLLFAAVAVKCSLGVYAVQVGDVFSESIEEVFSTTDRATSQNVEFLYTFKGVRPYKEVVESVNGNSFTTKRQYGNFETEFVIEKAIPLTGNYHILISIPDLLISLGSYFYWTWDDGTMWGVQGKFETNFLYRAASTIVIGDSCFEDNELVESVSIIPDYERKKLQIGRRAFYGAKNLKSVTVDVGFSSALDNCHFDYWGEFENLQLKSIGESAFEGCEKLAVFVCACDELESIGAYAFKDCLIFGGIMTDMESMENICFNDVNYSMWDENFVSFWQDVTFNCFTPKLSHIGQSAFYNAGLDVIFNPFYGRLEASETSAEYPEIFKWIFGKKDIVIEENAFYQCGFIREIHFPEDLERIGEKNFERLNCVPYDSDRPPTRLYFPESLVVVGDSAFAYSNVQVMNWSESLKEIGSNAFSIGARIKYEINKDQNGVIFSLQEGWTIGVPQTLEKLGEGAFRGDIQLGAWAKLSYFSDGTVSGLDYSDSALGACGPFGGKLIYPTNLTSVPSSCFANNVMLEEIVLHSSVTNIGGSAFMGCSRLNLIIPASVCEVGRDVGSDYSLISYGVRYLGSGPKSVVFEGKPPKGIVQSKLLDCSQVLVSAEYASDWAPYMNGNVKLAKKVDGEWVALGGKVISNAMRASDPTIMDIKYKVTSTKDKVNVRILAYKDGVRSFVNALPLATFVDGTAANVGDGVAANVEHTVSWQVSKDWDADLAKLSVEVFVMEDNLLPLQLTTIPAMGDKAAVTFSRNEQSGEKVMNALYWLYADKTSDLTLENGVLKSGGKQLVNGTSLSAENALSYIYSKMGYGLLSGDTLKYVNDLMRSSISSGKFAVKEDAAE